MKIDKFFTSEAQNNCSTLKVTFFQLKSHLKIVKNSVHFFSYFWWSINLSILQNFSWKNVHVTNIDTWLQYKQQKIHWKTKSVWNRKFDLIWNAIETFN